MFSRYECCIRLTRNVASHSYDRQDRPAAKFHTWRQKLLPSHVQSQTKCPKRDRHKPTVIFLACLLRMFASQNFVNLFWRLALLFSIYFFKFYFKKHKNVGISRPAGSTLLTKVPICFLYVWCRCSWFKTCIISRALTTVITGIRSSRLGW